MASSESTQKMWGGRPYWGLGYDHDPQWFLDDELKELQADLMEVCRTKIRPRAPECDRSSTFPRESINDLAELGLLGLLVPRLLGGKGLGMVAAANVVETIARYGCPSTAMVYVMHLLACSAMLMSLHQPGILDLIKRLDKDKLVGTVCYSDPGTGSNFWYQLSGKLQSHPDGVRVLKYGSWATSAGFADFYVISVSDDRNTNDPASTTIMVALKSETRSYANDWRALGLRGNQSGPIVVDAIIPLDRMISEDGKGHYVDDKFVPTFGLYTGSVYNGIAMAAMDTAKKHITRKGLGHVGFKICDYETTQAAFGKALSCTSALRLSAYGLAQEMDRVSNNCDWTKFDGLTNNPFAAVKDWSFVVKYNTSSNVIAVADRMLQLCGGTGFKEELGIERLLRDSRAGWIMAPSCEFIELYFGKKGLLGAEAVDWWEQKPDMKVLNRELLKLSVEEKRHLAKQLVNDIENDVGDKLTSDAEDFDNPFQNNNLEYKSQVQVGEDLLPVALCPDTYRPVTLIKRQEIGSTMVEFTFALPKDSSHLGCLPGQYVELCLDGVTRYVSPVSRPDDPGKLQVLLKLESQGEFSQVLRDLKPGDEVQVRGPCGGLEYAKNTLDNVVYITSGTGITPAIQLARTIANDATDSTKLTLLHYSETLDGVPYYTELKRIADTDPRLTLSVSLGEVPANWEGDEGFISEAIIKKYLTKLGGNEQLKVVLCGGSPLIVSVLQVLRGLGISSRDIFVFGALGTKLVRTVYGQNAQLGSQRLDQ